MAKKEKVQMDTADFDKLANMVVGAATESTRITSPFVQSVLKNANIDASLRVLDKVRDVAKQKQEAGGIKKSTPSAARANTQRHSRSYGNC